MGSPRPSPPADARQAGLGSSWAATLGLTSDLDASAVGGAADVLQDSLMQPAKGLGARRARTSSVASSVGASATGVAGQSDLRTLIQQKEKELHDINDYRIRSLEQALRDKDAQVQAQRDRFNKLKEDFQYNLKLIEDRDAELARYDAAFTDLKGVLREKDAEVGELKVRVVDLEAAVKRQAAQAEEADARHREKLRNAQAAQDSLRWSMEETLRKEREAMESLKADLERKLRKREDDMDAQRRELESVFDQVGRQRKQEADRKLEQALADAKEAHGKAKAAAAQTEELREQCARLRVELERRSSALEAAESRAKTAQWELDDLRRARDARVAELEREREQLQSNRQQLLDQYEVKMSEMLTALHAVEKEYVQQKEQFEARLQTEASSKEHEVRARSQDLESRLAGLSEKLRETESSLAASRTDFARAKVDLEERLALRDKQLAERQRQLDEGRSHAEAQAAQLAESEAELKRLHDQLGAAQEQVAEGQKQLVLARADAEKANAALEDVQQERDRLRNERLVATDDRVREGERKIRELGEERAELQRRLSEREARVAELESMATELRAQVEAVRGELRSAWFDNSRPASSSSVAAAAAAAADTGAAAAEGSDGNLFDGDLGPPSPIASLASDSASAAFSASLAVVEQPPAHPPAQAHDSAERARLQSENDRLQAALRSMRGEMEELTRELEQQQQQQQQQRNGGERRSSDAAAQTLGTGESVATKRFSPGVDNLVEENRLLHHQAQQMHTYVGMLQESERNQVEPGSECALLRDLLATQAKQLKLLKQNEETLLQAQLELETAAPRHEKAGDDDAQREALEEELRAVRAELKHVEGEREQLADLVNKLRADMQRPSAAASVTAQQLRQVEKQVATAFQSKISSVEQALDQIVQQNRLLKQQLRQQQQQQTHGAPAPGSPLVAEDEWGEERAHHRQTALRGTPAQQHPALGVLGTPPARVHGHAAARQSARDRLDEARRRLEQVGSGTNRAAARAGAGQGKRPGSASPKRQARSRATAAAPGTAPSRRAAGKVVIGKHRIRNYNLKG